MGSGYSDTMPGPSGRSEPSRLKGRLSEIYVPALLSGDIGDLILRLGDRATVDDPLFGRATGKAALFPTLKKASSWLAEHQGTFELGSLLAGSDRDVTEGRLILQMSGNPLALPIALVTEKRREREVEVRIYYSLRALRGQGAARGALLESREDVQVPPPVAALLDALACSDLDAAVASLEETATLRAGDGTLYTRAAGNHSLPSYFLHLISVGSAPGAARIAKNARADDGRSCALEYTLTHLRGQEVEPSAGLAIYERGESGLLSAVRVYDDVG